MRLLSLFNSSSLLKGGAFLVLLAMNQCTNLLCGGSQCGTSQPADSPGSFSTYAIVSFYSSQLTDMCTALPGDPVCYAVRDDFATPLASQNWTSDAVVTDGDIGGVWTPETTAGQIVGTRSNLLFINTHGTFDDSGIAQMALREWNGSNSGGVYSVGPIEFGPAWNGANWLVLDTCEVVAQNVGWESVFGGSLHGILGFDQDNSGLLTSGNSEFVNLIAGYDNALDAWDNATAASPGAGPYAAALIPGANASDAIEASGGPHFGYNNDTNPTYYARTNESGPLVPQSVATLSTAPTAQYSLIAEPMDETYWYNYYGGSSVPSTSTQPNSNEHLYRNPYVLVDHFLASGGLFVATQATGTAKGFSVTDALSYAQSWLQANGGLPSDAALTFAGPETMNPSPTQPTSDQPYPNVRQYVFIWHHADSAVLGNDRIFVSVNDAGHLTLYTSTYRTWSVHCNCYITLTRSYYAPPWVPVYQIHTYVRVWRTLGSPLSGSQLARHRSYAASGTYAYCSSEMSDPNSIAIPCQVTSSGTSDSYTDLTTGQVISTSEAL